MKYVLMMNTLRPGQGVPKWSKKDLQDHTAFMQSFIKEVRESARSPHVSQRPPALKERR